MPTSNDADQKNHVLLALLLVPAFVFLVIFALIFMAAGQQQEQQDMCLPNALGQPGADIDLNALPQNLSVAGYGTAQLKNAAYIIKAGKDQGLSLRDQIIGVMAAMGESDLEILDHGDSAGPDSRGLFQQRDNGAWGSYADRMNPYISATNFFKELAKIPNRDTLEPTIVAHRVQRNANPNHYTKWLDRAEKVVQALTKTQILKETPKDVHYGLGPVKPHTANVANTVGPKFGIKTVGGYRPPSSEKYDPNGHPAGLALDFMIDDIPNGKVTGDQLAAYLQQNAQQLGVKYIIWQQHIWNIHRASEGWRLMRDRGSPTQNHMDHVHLSLEATPGQGGHVHGGATPAVGNVCSPTTMANAQISKDGWVQPAKGPITSRYGMRVDPVTGSFTRLHAGVDLGGGGMGGPIYAAKDGVVSDIHVSSSGTWILAIDHGPNLRTRYLHMYPKDIQVHVGQKVIAGQQIAKVGSSGHSNGPHLHYEVHINGKPVDPEPFMRSVGVELK